MDEGSSSLADEVKAAIAPDYVASTSSRVGAKPRGGWLLRPVGFVGALAALLAALVFAIRNDVVGFLVMLAFVSAGFAIFWWALSRERRWRRDASSAAISAEHRWRDLLATAAGSPSDPRTSDSTQEPGFLEQARDLRREQLRRLTLDAQFDYMTDRGRGPGGLAIRGAETENVRRAEEARQTAITAARSVIEQRGLVTRYRELLEESQLALDDALRRMSLAETDDVQVARSAVEWTTLALVAETWIADADFAALYGPWWRAVSTERAPAWYAPWNTLSLAGSWLTMGGVICAVVLNQGVVGYVSLGIIIAGIACLVVGTLIGATHSKPWPVPARSVGLAGVHRSAGSDRLQRLWRSPELVSQWFVRRRS